ncbi:hypothetical protein HDA32_003027 [Spinactinospora alkalitolerans]|uniref:Uncharacterized protein n=1 Tax=Spinactinospora alkalitolerans TaxID=687207 RepID=A0A852TX82_9ACTN|nr:hypothetical protein [Spinactinospora alkalitolerans]NYE47907.1 hypothetical protein [Spinactinospora alkalitolerans]
MTAGPREAESVRLVERPEHRQPTPHEIRRDFGARYAANAVIALVFSATGPVAVILAAGSQGA